MAQVPVPCLPLWQCTALDSFLGICGKPVHSASPKSVSLPFLQKQGGSNTVLTLCAVFLRLHFCQAFQHALCDCRARPKHLHYCELGVFQCVVHWARSLFKEREERIRNLPEIPGALALALAGWLCSIGAGLKLNFPKLSGP